MTPKKDKGGRRRGEPKKTIGYKVPADVAEQVKEDVRPHVEKSVKKFKLMKLTPTKIILLGALIVALTSCRAGKDYCDSTRGMVGYGPYKAVKR